MCSGCIAFFGLQKQAQFKDCPFISRGKGVSLSNQSYLNYNLSNTPSGCERSKNGCQCFVFGRDCSEVDKVEIHSSTLKVCSN